MLCASLLAGCAAENGGATPGDPGGPANPGAGGGAASQQVECEPDNGGLELPDGFCALVVAEDVGRPRHMVVLPNGDLYVALRGGRDRGGGVLALRDTTGDGRPDVERRFGSAGGSGLAWRDGSLYFGTEGEVLRYPVGPEQLGPTGAAETVVTDLPTGGHGTKSLALGPDGALFMNIGSRSNACQEDDRAPGSPGMDPCEELETRAGIWRFDANATGQTQADGDRYATGLRNTVALTWNSAAGALYGVVHGRDQLHQNWPDLFTEEESAHAPSEELVRIDEGDNFGWPYCYHDPEQGSLVLAPEYGGDGDEVGRCAEFEEPLYAFPAHWAPIGLAFYSADQFPAEYAGGAFVTFHGSWNRAPLPQGGYNVSFLPASGGAEVAGGAGDAGGADDASGVGDSGGDEGASGETAGSGAGAEGGEDADGAVGATSQADESGRPFAGVQPGAHDVFADGFTGPDPQPRSAPHRPSGVAVGPDGSLYISDDAGGTIWRVLYRGD